MSNVQQNGVLSSSYGLARNYSTIDISADKWLMAYDAESLQKLDNPPSLADGLSREMEKDLRYLGCELIQSGSILLKLPQTAAATGQILFQRYYYQKSFVRYNFEHTVMACLLLASKIEEEPRKPRDVLNVYNRLKQIHLRRNSSNPKKTKYEHLELGSKNYLNLKNTVIKAERRILNTLGFVVHVHHPHKLVYVFLHVLGLLKNDEILQKSWNYMNDGLRTDMFLRYTPETIACACIYLAARTINQPIVLPKQPFPWFELFDASDRDIKFISSMLLELYKKKKVPSLSKLSAEVEVMRIRLTESTSYRPNVATAAVDGRNKADSDVGRDIQQEPEPPSKQTKVDQRAVDESGRKASKRSRDSGRSTQRRSRSRSRDGRKKNDPDSDVRRKDREYSHRRTKTDQRAIVDDRSGGRRSGDSGRAVQRRSRDQISGRR